MIDELFQFKNILRKPGVFLCLNGPISNSLVSEVGLVLERKLNMDAVRKPKILRLFSMVIENAQNIIHYSDEKLKSEQGDGISIGIIVVGYENGHYYIISGNMIKNHKVDGLRDYLTQISQMDKDQIKKLYRKKLKEGPHEGSKGAGVGFLEMAKKSSAPIEFNFRQIDGEYSFFSVRMIV